VHGDPRAYNIFVRESDAAGEVAAHVDVRFVSFDWAGHHAMATYPATLGVGPQDLKWLHSTDFGRRPEGVDPGKPITQALDHAVLALSLREPAFSDDDREEVW